MIDIDLVNVDFDLSKDKEHTTKYLNDLNNQTPFNVLDNTYTEHLRAVLNYSPILKIREPFKGCKPVTVADTYVGTYIGFNASGNWDINSDNLSILNTHTIEKDLGEYMVSTLSEQFYATKVDEKYVFSTTVTNPDKVRKLQYQPSDMFFGQLVTDFVKDGVPLTMDKLAQGVEARFLLPTQGTFTAMYSKPIITGSSFDRKSMFTFPEAELYSDELHLYYTHVSINGHLINTQSDVDLLGISGLRVEVDRGISHLKTNTPVVLDIEVHDDTYLNNNLYASYAQGDNIYSSIAPNYKLYLLPS